MSSNPINLTVTLAAQVGSTGIHIPTTLYTGLGCVDTVAGENITFTKLYFANNIKHFKGEEGKNLFAENADSHVTREVYFDGTAEDWLNITFDYPNCNPLFDGGNLYFKNPKTNKYDLVTQFVLADASHSEGGHAIRVPNYSLYGCLSLRKLVLVNEIGLESIGKQAFYNCKNLKEVYLDRPITGIPISFGDMAFANEDQVDFATSTAEQAGTDISPSWAGALPKNEQDGIEAVYFNGTIQEWCSSQFGTVTEGASTRNTTTANPLHSGSYLYLKSGLGYDRQTDLVVPQLPDNAPLARTALNGLRINSIDLSAVNILGAAGLLTNCTVHKLILPYLESEEGTPTHLGYFFTDIELQENLAGDIKQLSRALIDLIPSTLHEVTVKGGHVGGIALDASLQITQAIQGFVGCEYLKNICFDSGVVAIAEGATCGCKSLESITINSFRQEKDYQLGDIFGTPDQLAARLSLDRDEGLTDADTAYIEKYFGESIEQIYPKTLKFRTGGDNAYNSGCKTYLPKTLKTCTILQDQVSPGAFAGCTQLENIFLKNVTVIGAWAFFNCTGLTSIKIPDSTNRIGSSVFAGCDNLKALDLPFCGGRLFEDAFEITPNRDYHALLPSPESLNPNNINDATVKEAKENELGNLTHEAYEEWIVAQDLFNRLELADLSLENAPELKLYYDGTTRNYEGYDPPGIPIDSARYYYLSLDHILPYLFEHIYDKSNDSLSADEVEKPAMLGSNYYCTLARICKPFKYSRSELSYVEYEDPDLESLTGWYYNLEDAYYSLNSKLSEDQSFSGRMIAYIPNNLSSLTIRQGALQREAFAGFTSLKDLTLGAGIQDIALIAEEELARVNIYRPVAVLDELWFAYGQPLPELPSRLLGFPWQDCHGLTTLHVDVKNRKYFASGTYLCERTLDSKAMLLMAAESGIAQNSGILDISESVDRITPAAFYKHQELKHFAGNKLEGIPKACFFYCQSLESIEALNLSYCKEFAFNGCTGLIKISLKENPSVVYQPQTGWNRVEYPKALPSKDQFIGSFQNSAKLTEVDAPIWAILYCDVQNIETLRISCGPTIEMKDFVMLRLAEQVDYAYTYKLSYVTPPEFLKMKKLIIGSEVQYITDRVFYIAQMPTVTEYITLPVKSSGHQLPALEQIIIEDRSPNCNHYYSGLVGHAAFSSCPTIKELIIGEGIETIGASSFAHATQLEKVSLPTTLTVISNRAFENCKSLLEITCPKGLLGIGDSTFRNCHKLRIVNFNRCLKFIGEYAFANTDLQSLELILDEPTNFTWGDLDYQIVEPILDVDGKGNYDIVTGGTIRCHISEIDPMDLSNLPWDPNSVAAVTLQSKYTYLSSWTNYAENPHNTYQCFRNMLTHDVPALQGLSGTASVGSLCDGICVTAPLSLSKKVDSRGAGDPTKPSLEVISWRQKALADSDTVGASNWGYKYISQTPAGNSSLEFNMSDGALFTEDITISELDLAMRCTLLLRTQIQSSAFANTSLKRATIQVGPKNQPALIQDQAFYACTSLRELYLDCEGVGFVRPTPLRDSSTKLQVTWEDASFYQGYMERKAFGLLNGGLENGTLQLGPSVKALGTLAFRSTGLTSVDLSAASALNQLPAGCFQKCLNLESARLSPNISALEARFAQLAPEGADYLEFLGNPFSGCENLQAVYGLEPSGAWKRQLVQSSGGYGTPTDWNIFMSSNPSLEIAKELKDKYEYRYYK